MIDVDTIVRILTPAVNELGLDLYDVDVSGSGRARVVRVLIDREGGIDLEAIADATQSISPLLDAPPLDAVVSGAYALEVSSPGLERPLRTPAHYERAVGETVSVKIRARDDRGARRVRGTITAADDTGFELTLDDGTSERLGYDDAKTRTVFEWAKELKGAEAKSKQSTSSQRTSPQKTSPQRESVRP